MKLVTNDYGCGTSSSILDYGIEDVVIVSENNYEHVFEQNDDLLFIGHDFLFYLWDTEEKMKRWISYSQKNELWLWCFERVDAIIPQWKQKSHVSVSIASKFCKRILACDEDDCEKYGFDWLPQWASKKFYDMRHVVPSSEKILFSGQAGPPEYHLRNQLIKEISEDTDLASLLEITNTRRTYSWDDYIKNLLNYRIVLNPIGILRALNTRAFEGLYSGRIVLQHTVGKYEKHQNLLKNDTGIVFFTNIAELKQALKRDMSPSAEASYTSNSLHARMKSIGINIK